MTNRPSVSPELVPTPLLLIPLIIFLPTTVFYLGLASSFAFGTAAAGIAIILLCVMSPRLATAALIDGTLIAGGAILLLAAHLLVAALFVPVDYPRAIGSFAILYLVFVGSIAAGRAILSAPDRSIDLAMHLSFWLLIGVGVLGALGLVPIASPTARYYERPVFPFTEPSHYALCMTPVLTYCCVSSSRLVRALYLGLVLVLLVTLQSLTMAAGWLIVAIVCARGFVFLAVVGAMAFMAYTFVDLEYYVDRLDLGNEQSGNLSNLIYNQGWQLIGESLLNSQYWGIGFQQLGVFGTDVPNSRIIYLLVGDYANVLDGGFTFSKLMSELGPLGLIVFFVLSYCAAQGFFVLRKVAASPGVHPPIIILIYSVFVSYMAELMLRGAGYFTSSGMLVLAALIIRHTLIRKGRSVHAVSRRLPAPGRLRPA